MQKIVQTIEISAKKKPTRKQHIYFLPTRKANTEKIKELFLADAQIRLWKSVKK
jgi:hypothetical protein